MWEAWLQRQGLGFTTEHRFHPTRRWRLDWALPDHLVAVELEGLCYGRKSRHTTIAGYEGDCEKYNAAQLLGWRVLRYSQRQFSRGDMVADISALAGIDVN